MRTALGSGNNGKTVGGGDHAATDAPAVHRRGWGAEACRPAVDGQAPVAWARGSSPPCHTPRAVGSRRPSGFNRQRLRTAGRGPGACVFPNRTKGQNAGALRASGLCLRDQKIKRLVTLTETNLHGDALCCMVNAGARHKTTEQWLAVGGWRRLAVGGWRLAVGDP